MAGAPLKLTLAAAAFKPAVVSRIRGLRSDGDVALPDASFPLSPVSVPGVCVKDRWRELLRVTQPHSDDHVTLFNDLHFLMASLGAKNGDTSRRLLEGLQELAK